MLVQSYILKLPRFDFLNRILAVNIIIYSFLGLTLSTLRLPLVSREVFLSEFLLSGALLIVYHMLRHKFFPKRLGVLPGVDITSLASYPSLEVVPVDSGFLQNRKLDGVVTNLRGAVDTETSHLLTDLAQQRVPVHDANTLIETLWGRLPLDKLSLVELESFTPPVVYSQVKRFTDIALVIAFAPLLVILALIIGATIKLSSPGPILFRQIRVGLNGRPFTILKFRSMSQSPVQSTPYNDMRDPVVTPVGLVLRRLRLDELPQFLNILRGEMSLIGPRPEQQTLADRFNIHIPFYNFRHTIRPGITGWAQVMYGYTVSDEETKTKLGFDFFYLKHMSLWLDLVIVVKTIRTIIVDPRRR
jgi:lipopolysaccharide/colanic/teichoic acid biosynthesis glycosyltransferase